MKVLDLQCVHGHTFEAWFASEDEFQRQNTQSMIACPLCGSTQLAKKLSAPRLNLSAAPSEPQHDKLAVATGNGEGSAASDPLRALAAAWVEMSRRVVASTQDVGERFAEEARRMHYGETEERAIRGRTSLEEARALHEEGIAVVPLALPEHLTGSLH